MAAPTKSDGARRLTAEEQRRMASEANAKKVIHPRIEFTPNGDKHAEGSVIVRFRESGLTRVENPKARAGMPDEFLATHVDLLEASDFGQEPGTYQLLLAGGERTKSSSLTDGVMRIWQERNENLEGAVARITTSNYDHPTWGRTRKFIVDRLKDREAAPAGAQKR